MIIIRPIQDNDFDDLHQMAIESGHGFTSLPVNDRLLKNRIIHSKHSFHKKVLSPANENYLLVMEDTTTGKVIGTSGLAASVGLEDAFYHYRLGKVVHSSRELNIYNTIATLSLCNDYTAAAELCTLFLSADYRKDKNGSLLSRSRFLLMAEHPHRFSETVIAELRGVSDDKGRSPFWAWLEENFFSIDFPTADYLTGIGKKEFIAELMPKYPIYVSLLSKKAQQVIGQVHEKTRPALRLLENEGFSRRGYVDIFDAGPTVEAKLKDINTIKNSKKFSITIGEVKHGKNYIIANTLLKKFRALQTQLLINEAQNNVIIEQAAANDLLLKNGDYVRIALQ